MKKLFTLFLACVLAVSLCACGGNNAGEGNTKLSFKAAAGYDYLKSISGKTVVINGYMATSSPVDGSYIYLMNMPYQSCPFCKPNTSQLSNTMAVYPESGKRFDYTTQAIAVTGKLEVAEQNDLFSDPYGYEFSFKIVDAEYKILSSEDLTESMALWQKISSSGIINEVNDMYEYVNFLCQWNTYFCNSTVAADGTVEPGYYLYDTDALYLITTEGAQYNYGYQDGYFEGLISSVENLDKNGFADLVENIKKAKALAEKALYDLENGEFTYEYQYVEQFDNSDYVYTLNNGEELSLEMDELYYEFSMWLASWEV